MLRLGFYNSRSIITALDVAVLVAIGHRNGAQRVQSTKPCNFISLDLERIREIHLCISGRFGVEVGIL